jgi:hypothetical protein
LSFDVKAQEITSTEAAVTTKDRGEQSLFSLCPKTKLIGQIIQGYLNNAPLS